MTPRHALAALAAPHRHRVILDAEGWPIIPGRYGRLEWHDGRVLAVYTDRPRLFARLWTVSGRAAGRSGTRKLGPWCPLRPFPRSPP